MSNSINFDLGNKPIDPADIERARDTKDFTPAKIGYDRASKALSTAFKKYSEEFAEKGELQNPVLAAKDLSQRYDQASQSLVQDNSGSYLYDRLLEDLDSRGGEILDLLSNVKAVEVRLFGEHATKKAELINRLTRVVGVNIIRAFDEGAQNVEDATKAGGAKLRGDGEYLQVRDAVSDGFIDYTEISERLGGYQIGVQTDLNTLYERLDALEGKTLQRITGFSEPGEILGSIVQRIAELDGPEFNQQAQRLERVVNPEGKAYVYIRQFGRDAANDWKEKVEPRADSAAAKRKEFHTASLDPKS